MQTTTRYLLAFVTILALHLSPAMALSTNIGRDVNFPSAYDVGKRAAILRVVQDEGFNFVGGTVSHWPPDWGTRLSYTGDALSLNRFLNALREIRGVGLSVLLYRGRDDEARRDSDWQLDFSQAHPDRLTVYINLNSKLLDWEKVKLPDWAPAL